MCQRKRANSSRGDCAIFQATHDQGHWDDNGLAVAKSGTDGQQLGTESIACPAHLEAGQDARRIDRLVGAAKDGSLGNKTAGSTGSATDQA